MAKGVLKWFSAEKHYGFIERHGESDLFVHQVAVEESGFSVAEMLSGASIEFLAGEREGRMCCLTILNISGGKPGKRSSFRNHSRRAERSPRPELPVGATGVGRVEIFNVEKGYGFLAVVGQQVADVFFHIDDIPPHLLQGDPEIGDQFHFTVIERRGKLKAAISNQ